jgi:hypothetical protein
MSNSNSCRLCSGTLEFRFSKLILSSIHVKYYQCKACSSLQTEAPHWLSQAYTDRNERFDTGQFIRCLHNAAFLHSTVHYAGLERDLILDYGCGSGLTARILRDVGLDAWGYDRHSAPRLLMGFLKDGLEGARIVNLCEVAEHFTDPRGSFDHIFSVSPDVVICATEIYQGQGSDWSYLSPEHGQHVFFYSQRGMRFLAEHYGYGLVSAIGYSIFFAPRMKDRFVDPASHEIHSDFALALAAATPLLMQKILELGYEHAIFDNQRLLIQE